jgi:multiple sugar transport system permease protein
MKRNLPGRAGHHLLALSVTAVFSLPLFWVMVASLRAPGLPPPSQIEWWPQEPHYRNYALIFELLPFGRYLANSLLVVAAAVPLTLLTSSLAGFSLAQLPGRQQRRLFALSVALLLIPAASVWIFRFQILRWLGLVDSLWALILPAFAASSPLFVLLYYWSYRQVPAELFEAALLDGASALASWRRLALPLVHPTTVAVTVLTFVMYWSDFISPLLYIYRPSRYTLAVGLQILNQLDPTNWPLLMAAAVLMTSPVLLLFAWLQRYFLHDLSLANLVDRN